jgi:hypothetical protein
MKRDVMGGRIARMEERRNLYKVLVGKDYLEDLDVDRGILLGGFLKRQDRRLYTELI